MSHLQKPKSQNKSWGVAAVHGFERLQKVTGARQTAQDSSPASQASSSPGAQRDSQLISCLLCRKRGCRKYPVLHPHLCFSLILTAATQSRVKQSSLSSRDKLSFWGERCFLGWWTAAAPSGHPCACPGQSTRSPCRQGWHTWLEPEVEPGLWQGGNTDLLHNCFGGKGRTLKINPELALVWFPVQRMEKPSSNQLHQLVLPRWPAPLNDAPFAFLTAHSTFAC